MGEVGFTPRVAVSDQSSHPGMVWNPDGTAAIPVCRTSELPQGRPRRLAFLRAERPSLLSPG